MDDLRNQHNMLKDQVAGLPKPLNKSETQDIAHTEAIGALDEASRRNKKYSVVSANIGPTYGAGRTGNFTFSGRGQFFSPFGGEGTHAVQAQGEYMYYPGRQEGQFDIGLVNRWGSIQAGAFGSFKYLNFKEFQGGGGLGQAAPCWTMCSRAAASACSRRRAKNTAVLNQAAWSAVFPADLRASGEPIWRQRAGGAGVMPHRGHAATAAPRPAMTPGGSIKLVQPFNGNCVHCGSGLERDPAQRQRFRRVVFGFNWAITFIRRNGKTSPVMMDVPRVLRIADAAYRQQPAGRQCGPDQVGVAAGTVTLDGSDPMIRITIRSRTSGRRSAALR